MAYKAAELLCSKHSEDDFEGPKCPLCELVEAVRKVPHQSEVTGYTHTHSPSICIRLGGQCLFTKLLEEIP